MSEIPAVSLICCGMLGTTVADDGMVEQAYAEAIATQGVVTGTTAYARCMAQVHRARGRATIDVFESLFPENQVRAQAAQLAFDRSYTAAIGRTGISALPGAEEALDKLTGTGAKVCLFTGFTRRVTEVLLEALSWESRADLVLCPEDAPRGCPAPDLILTAMLRLGVRDVQDTAVVHATEGGVLAGQRSGAGMIVGVLTGIHTRDRLRKAGATHLLNSVAGLPELVSSSWSAEGLSRPPAVRGGRHASPAAADGTAPATARPASPIPAQSAGPDSRTTPPTVVAQPDPA
jgi:phosphoglycolate phosphatase